jgi:hypothetical protein
MVVTQSQRRLYVNAIVLAAIGHRQTAAGTTHEGRTRPTHCRAADRPQPRFGPGQQNNTPLVDARLPDWLSEPSASMAAMCGDPFDYQAADR